MQKKTNEKNLNYNLIYIYYHNPKYMLLLMLTE